MKLRHVFSFPQYFCDHAGLPVNPTEIIIGDIDIAGYHSVAAAEPASFLAVRDMKVERKWLIEILCRIFYGGDILFRSILVAPFRGGRITGIARTRTVIFLDQRFRKVRIMKFRHDLVLS